MPCAGSVSGLQRRAQATLIRACAISRSAYVQPSPPGPGRSVAGFTTVSTTSAVVSASNSLLTGGAAASPGARTLNDRPACAAANARSAASDRPSRGTGGSSAAAASGIAAPGSPSAAMRCRAPGGDNRLRRGAFALSRVSVRAHNGP